jgi:hypothetical protein
LRVRQNHGDDIDNDINLLAKHDVPYLAGIAAITSDVPYVIQVSGAGLGSRHSDHIEAAGQGICCERAPDESTYPQDQNVHRLEISGPGWDG